jgi:hypothetical protein
MQYTYRNDVLICGSAKAELLESYTDAVLVCEKVDNCYIADDIYLGSHCMVTDESGVWRCIFTINGIELSLNKYWEYHINNPSMWNNVLSTLKYIHKSIRLYHDNTIPILEIRKNGEIYTPLFCNRRNHDKTIWVQCTNINYIILCCDRVALYFFAETFSDIVKKRAIETPEMKRKVPHTDHFIDIKIDFF